MQKRNSSIELIKLLAIIGIVISHAIPDGDKKIYQSAIDINNATTDIQLFLIVFLKNLGQIGNIIFLVSSSWFLIEEHKVNGKKMIEYIVDCFLISVIGLFIFLLLGYRFPIKYMIKQLFPVTYGNCWYLTCYLLLYGIHPQLNIIIETVEKRIFFSLAFSFFILYNIIGFLCGNKRFYWSEIVGFIGIYFIIAYFKKYLLMICDSVKNNVLMLCLGILGWISMTVVTNGLGLRIELLSKQLLRWNTWMNPCFLLIAFSLFNLARRQQFYCKAINYVSSMTLLIYMIHCNRIIRDYVRFDVFEKIFSVYTYKYLICWILLYGLISLIGSVFIAFMYKKLMLQIANKISYILWNIILKIYDSIYLLINKCGGGKMIKKINCKLSISI